MTRIERIFDCPMYSDCLAEKAKADAKIFTCADCKKDTTFIQEENMVSKVQSTPEIYARVQSRMLAMNLSVKRFAQLIGTSKSQIHKMRAGGEITLEYWDRVAKGLGVTTDWLLYGGKGLNEDKTVDSKQSTEDKNEAVGSGNKAVKVLEMYELKENGRLATIGIKDGKYQHVYIEGINQCKWSYDDVMFLYKATGEVLRLVQG